MQQKMSINLKNINFEALKGPAQVSPSGTDHIVVQQSPKLSKLDNKYDRSEIQ